MTRLKSGIGRYPGSLARSRPGRIYCRERRARDHRRAKVRESDSSSKWMASGGRLFARSAESWAFAPQGIGSFVAMKMT